MILISLNFNKAEFIASYGLLNQIPEDCGLEITFAGRSNVGKSSLLNKIFNRKSLARVSSMPGKTATINFYKISDEVNLVDLPGYGYAKVSKSEKKRWQELIEGYLMDQRNIALVVLLIDSRHAPSKDDLHMINFLIENEFPFIITLTKIDKMKKMALQERLESFKKEIPYYEDITVIQTSSETGLGIEELKNIINDIAEGEEVQE